MDNAIGTGTLILNGGTIANPSGFVTLSNPITVSAISAVGGGGFLTVNGDIVLNATLRVTHGGFPTFNGALSGPGGLSIEAFPGRPKLAGSTANTFTGGVNLITGELTLQKQTGVNAIASPITIAGGSFPTLIIGASNQIADGVPITMGIGSLFKTNDAVEAIGSINGIGTIDTGTVATNGLTILGSGTSLFTGTVTGAGIVRNLGTGTLTLGGASAGYTGQLTASAGLLLASADFSNATVLTQTGATR